MKNKTPQFVKRKLDIKSIVRSAKRINKLQQKLSPIADSEWEIVDVEGCLRLLKNAVDQIWQKLK